MCTKILARLALALAFLLPAAAFAGTTLQIEQGSGDLQSFQTAITVDAPEAVAIRWQTDASGATGGTWVVTRASNPNQIVAQGETGAAPAVGHIAVFTIPATGTGSFLASTPPNAPGVKYVITVTPHDASNHALGAAATPVSVTQVKSGPQTPVNFGAGAVFPDVELVSYVEHGTGLTATVTVRAVNNGSVATDPMNLGLLDDNLLMRVTGGAKKIKALAPGASTTLSFTMNAILPAPTSQTPEDAQLATWNAEYQSRCGVDLHVDLDWAGPAAQAPVNDHKEVYLYQGFHNSKSWQQNHPVSDVTVCDDKFCVPLNQVARSVFKQIGCKVVGYALFVGDKTTGSHAIYDAFGQARTSSSPPARDFTPTTPMQIASSSKVLTGITAFKAMGGKFDQPAFKFFPSNWAVPSALVQKITSRELVSMTSGVQQYYAGATGGQSYANLQAFFTQPIPNPGAPYLCPGTPHAATPATAPATPFVPATLPNPIISDKTPCYTDTNFGLMRLVIPRATGSTAANDNATLSAKYVKLVKDNIWTPLGLPGPDCAQPAANTYALLYKYPGQIGADWLDNTATCGDWGWYVSVKEYGKLLVSLNSADHKVLTDCQLWQVENDPSNHPIGFDGNSDGVRRYLQKDGAEGQGNNTLQTTVVAIFLGHSGCPTPPTGFTAKYTTPMPGVAGALWINSDISGQPNAGAWTILRNAFQSAVRAKP
jgi:CubicO group peptidase (beta-lactamase class C family)